MLRQQVREILVSVKDEGLFGHTLGGSTCPLPFPFLRDSAYDVLLNDFKAKQDAAREPTRNLIQNKAMALQYL